MRWDALRFQSADDGLIEVRSTRDRAGRYFAQRSGSAVILLLGLLLTFSTPALAADPSFTDGAIHCPNGHAIPWSAERRAPTQAEQRLDCLLLPSTSGATAPASEEPTSTITGTIGSDFGDFIDKIPRVEAEQKRKAEALEHEHLLAGKFGEWPALNAALADRRSDIYLRILGKWTGYLIVGFVALALLFGRKR